MTERFAALPMSQFGPKLPTRNVRYSVAIGGKADVTRASFEDRV